MEFSEQIDVPTNSVPFHLRRTHSLDIQNNQDDSFENDLGIDTDAAQMLEYLSDYEFLDDFTVDTENFTEEVLNNSTLISDTANTTEMSNEVSTALSKVNGTDRKKKVKMKSRRLQILELRKSVMMLTSQLDSLTTGTSHELIGSSGRCSRQLSPPMWKSVALRQFKRRRSAEADNIKLREIVEMQVHEAKCLQRILKRRAKIQLMEDMLGMKSQKGDINLAVPANNSQMFMKMLRELDESYRVVDRYFMPMSCIGDKKMNSTAITGVVFETTKSHLLPFSLCEIKKCSWAILKNVGTGDVKKIHGYFNKLVDLDVQHYEESHNTIAMSSFSPTAAIEDIGGVLVRKVMRMYIEEHQAVFTWKILAEPKLEGSNLPAGYQIQTTLQAVIRRNDTPTLSGGESTQLLLHFIGSRFDHEIAISSRFRYQGHNEISIGLWEKLVSRKPSEIESEVIDQLFGTSRHMVHPEQALMVSL